jgi:hypothetical protein
MIQKSLSDDIILYREIQRQATIAQFDFERFMTESNAIEGESGLDHGLTEPEPRRKPSESAESTHKYALALGTGTRRCRRRMAIWVIRSRFKAHP